MSNEDQGVVVTFTAQEWVNDYAMEIDPKGEDSWTISTKEFEEITGLTLSDYEDPDEIDLDTNDGDNLKYYLLHLNGSNSIQGLSVSNVKK